VKSNRQPRFDRARPPVMLLGGLNVTRALGLAGIPVIVASGDAHEPAFASRYCSARLRLPLDDRHAALEALLASGASLAAGLGRRVPLFYGNDDSQRLVHEYRAELSEHYALLLNDAEVADAVIQKDLFQPFAAARGLPIPRALSWEALESFEHAVLVKPRSKLGWKASPVHVRLFGRRGKARIFPNGRALLAEAHARQLRDEILIQEYVSGDDRHIWSFHGFADEEHRLLDWFIGRKIRTYPALTGESTYLQLARDEELAALGPRLAAALPLKGVFKIDLKRDARTGRFHVLEVNARYNLWHYLGAANGANLPRTAYAYLVDGERPARQGRYGTTYRWIHLRGDWCAYRQLAARGELNLAGWLASLAAAPKVCQLFSWADPLPFITHLYRRVRARLPRLPGMLRRWLSTAS
jgi:predicted ATP-grasp superfamily ATP-dependent carboligase